MSVAKIARVVNRVRSMGHMTVALQKIHNAFYLDAASRDADWLTDAQVASLSNVVVAVAARCSVMAIGVKDLNARIDRRRVEFVSVYGKLPLPALLSQLAVYMLGASELEKNTAVTSTLRARVSGYLELIMLTIEVLLDAYGDDLDIDNINEIASDEVQKELTALLN